MMTTIDSGIIHFAVIYIDFDGILDWHLFCKVRGRLAAKVGANW